MRAGARTVIHSIPDQLAPQETSLSFDEAFTLHHRAVFATARGVVRDTALAEEITQEVFLKLYRHFDSKPNDELLRAWLLRVTLNEARNMLRGQNRSRARDTTYQRKTDQPGPQVEYEERWRWKLHAALWTRSKSQCALFAIAAAGTFVPGNSPDAFVERKLRGQSVARAAKSLYELRQDWS